MDDRAIIDELRCRLAAAEAALGEKTDLEAALRESRERLHVALASAELGTFVWHVAEDRTEEDARARAHFGLPPDGTISLADALATTFHPDDGPRYVAAVARAIDPAGPGRLHEEYRIRHPDGQERWMSTTAITTFEGTPRVAVRLTGALADVTDRKRAEAAQQASEERQEFLLALSDALRPLSDPVEIEGAACRILGEHLGVERAYYVEIDEPRGTAIVARDFVFSGAPSLVGEHPVASFAWSVNILRRGECHVVADTRESPLVPTADRAALAALRIVACMGAPLIETGALVGALCVTSAQPRAWSEAEVALLSEVGQRIWSAVQRARAEEALRASEVRFRALVTAGGNTIYRMSPDWRLMYQLDSNTLAVTAEPIEDWVGKYIIAEDLPRVRATIDEAIRTKALFELEHRVLLADGSVGWVLSRAVPLLGPDGQIVEWFGAGSDVSSRKEAEAALRESEERFAQFAASSSDALWIRDAGTLAMEYTSPAIETIYGIAPDAMLGDMQRWVGLIVPECRETAVAHLEQARAGASVTHEFRVRRPSDGEERWIRNTDFPLSDARGRVQRIGGIAEDVTEAKAAAGRQDILAAELQHRTRNLMGVVRSMADKTLARSTDLTDFRARYGDRLAALARVQGLLSRLEEWDRVTFDELLRSEMAALNGESGRIALDGPEGVALRSSTVQTFALALHELMTNALKYGALAQPRGHLAIRWRVERAERDGRPWLHVDWRESGVAMPAKDAPPRGSGQGRELIERALPYQLGARTTYVMAEDGVHCAIALPVSERSAARKTVDA